MSRDSGFGPAVLNGKLRYVSVSQIEKYDEKCFAGCARRWWFRYVGGLPEKQTKRQKLGTQVHSQIEHYLKTGEDVLGELARAGKHFIPAPLTTSPGLEVEAPVGGLREYMPGGFHGAIDSDLDCAGVPVVGFLDVINFRQLEVNDAGESVAESGVVEALDWKSTKQIDDEIDPCTGIVSSRGYAKTAEELSHTHQMVGYGVLLLRRFSWAKAARLSHGYFQTSGARKATKRSTLVSADEIRARWRNRSEPVVEKMKETARAAEVGTVPANLKACSAYGGCPYVDKCPRDAKAVLREMFSGGSMGLLDKVRTPAKPPATETPAPANSAVAAEIAALEAEENTIRGNVIVDMTESLTPPDAPAPSAVAELPDTTPAIGCQAEQQVKLDVDAIASKKFACPCGATTKVKPTKLGDGNYYAVVPKHEKPAAATETPTAKTATFVFSGAKSAEVRAKEATKESLADSCEKHVESEAAKPAGITLYLDALEHGVHAERLEPYAYMKAAALAAHEGAPDVRCAPEKSSLSFGKWKGALAGLVRLEPPPPGIYAVTMSNEIAAVVAEALIPLATRIVQAAK